jgi:hypothetical protein
MMGKQQQSGSTFRVDIARALGALGAGAACPSGYYDQTVKQPFSTNQNWCGGTDSRAYRIDTPAGQPSCGKCIKCAPGTGANDDFSVCVPIKDYCGSDYPLIGSGPDGLTTMCPGGQTVKKHPAWPKPNCYRCETPGGGGGGGSCGSDYPHPVAANGAMLCPGSGDPAGASKGVKDPTGKCYRCTTGGCPGDYFSKNYWTTHTCSVALQVNPSDSNCLRCPSGQPAAGGGAAPGGGPNVPGSGQNPVGRGTPPPICQAPFGWQQTCTADHPKVILSQDGCNTCLRNSAAACPQGYYRPPQGWIFGGCPAGYNFVINDETGCVSCLIGGCPSPYQSGPLVCQAGWQPVHHPYYTECQVCAPGGAPGTTVDQSGVAPGGGAAPAPAPGGTTSAAPTTVAPATAGMSTGAKLGIGAAILIGAYMLFGKKK